METWQIILAIIIVGLSIVMPIYYSYKKKKLAQQLKEGREVTEREKIRVYMDNINEKFRNKRRWKRYEVLWLESYYSTYQYLFLLQDF